MTTQPHESRTAFGPLAGVRVITFTQAWSGTFTTELLGFLGADVIQIEARRRPDTWRGGYQGAIPEAIQGAAERQRRWNVGPLYNAVNLNKRGITLDIGDPQGAEYFRRLVPLADVIVDNFSPRVMGNWGLAYADLDALRPGIIQASLSAYGASGPYRDIPGIGGTIEPMSGMSSLLGYEDGNPLNSGNMYPDPVAGVYMTTAIVACTLPARSMMWTTGLSRAGTDCERGTGTSAPRFHLPKCCLASLATSSAETSPTRSGSSGSGISSRMASTSSSCSA